MPTATKATTKITLRVNAATPAAKLATDYPAASASGEKVGRNRPKLYRIPSTLPRGSVGLPELLPFHLTNSGMQYATHRPVGPRGSVVLVNDNKNINRTKAVTNNPEPKKMIIRFKDVKGNVHQHKYPDHASQKWDDDAWIASLNKWRYQTISRKFKYDPSVVRGRRGKWTMAEKIFLKEQITKKIEVNGDRLIGEDWKAIAKAHNERFAGTVVKKGEQLIKGFIAIKDYTLTERSYIAIRTQFDKMADLKQEMEDLVAESTESEGEEGTEPMEGVVKEEENTHGGELDHHLEDPSDDEDAGQRPASNQTGAILVEGAC
jgi:hypothetical protein